MSSIFISYRRSDSADVSGRIYDRLVEHFGDEAIFKDVDDIPFGVDFKTYLSDVVAKCDVELVIIGPTWLDVTNETGQRRLDDPADFVRIEVEAALERNIPVVPLLVGGAMMPKGSALPPGLSSLTFRNGTLIRPDPDFHHDMNRLIKGLDQYVSPRARPYKPAAKPKPAPAMPVPQTPPSAPAETVLYEHAGDRITNYMAKVGGATYPISDLRSASAGKRKPTNKESMKLTPTLAITYLAFGLFGLSGFIGPDSGWPIFFFIVMIVMMVVDQFEKSKRKHTVNIVDSRGEREILISKDKAHVHRIAEAINEACARMHRSGD